MLKIKKINKTHGNRNQKVTVFTDFSLDIAQGEFVAVVGPNGCGKTTLLNILGNLTQPDSGTVTINGESLNSHKIGYVFQDYRNTLFPWLKMKDNIAFPLKIQQVSKHERYAIVKKIYETFGCTFDLHAYPYQLSGGQQQLASLMRGLISEPHIYLLDEPFSSLDYQTTLFLLEKLVDMWQKTKTTTLVATHEIDEAIFLAQRIILLSSKPTTIVKSFINPLPYPRTLSVLSTPAFANLKSQVIGAYTKEVLRSSATPSGVVL